jgi:hypothetical protein
VPLIESMRTYGREWLGGECGNTETRAADTAGARGEPLLVTGGGRQPAAAAA